MSEGGNGGVLSDFWNDVFVAVFSRCRALRDTSKVIDKREETATTTRGCSLVMTYFRERGSGHIINWGPNDRTTYAVQSVEYRHSTRFHAPIESFCLFLLTTTFYPQSKFRYKHFIVYWNVIYHSSICVFIFLDKSQYFSVVNRLIMAENYYFTCRE